MKTIPVPVGGSDADALILETALAVARPLCAHLELLHVRVAVADTAVYTPHLGLPGAPGLEAPWMRSGARVGGDRKRLRTTFATSARGTR